MKLYRRISGLAVLTLALSCLAPGFLFLAARALEERHAAERVDALLTAAERDRRELLLRRDLAPARSADRALAGALARLRGSSRRALADSVTRYRDDLHRLIDRAQARGLGEGYGAEGLARIGIGTAEQAVRRAGRQDLLVSLLALRRSELEFLRGGGGDPDALRAEAGALRARAGGAGLTVETARLIRSLISQYVYDLTRLAGLLDQVDEMDRTMRRRHTRIRGMLAKRIGAEGRAARRYGLLALAAFLAAAAAGTGVAGALLRRRFAAARASEARFRSLAQHGPDAVAAIGADGSVRYLNPPGARLFGFEPGEAEGASLFERVHPDDLLRLREGFAASPAGEAAAAVEFRLRNRAGEWRWLDATAGRLPDGGLVVHARDVSERRRQETEIREAKEKAVETSRLKTSFLANMSHELRTPLAGIMGLASLIQLETEDPGLQENAAQIESNGRRLLETLTSVLELSRLEAGAVSPQLRDVPLADEVHDAAELFAPLAAEKGLELEIVVRTGPVQVVADPVLLRHVLGHLLSNAVKFTHEGGVRVEVEAGGGSAAVRVRDSGIGIGAEFLPHVFDAFRQESTGLSRSYEGSGIGLAVARRMAELMGSTVDAESRRGEGSTFTLRLPLAVAFRASSPSFQVEESAT